MCIDGKAVETISPEAEKGSILTLGVNAQGTQRAGNDDEKKCSDWSWHQEQRLLML
jgi:hypothetical protein